MILIFGGAYQGKLAYALDRFYVTESDVYRCKSDDVRMPENRKLIYEIDKWILALVENNIDVEKAMRQFIDCNQDAVVICNDISCGVVPLDPVLRKWREAVGRSLAVLSRTSDEVIRLFCAIPARVK
ncbi:MAG: bifunctional adenosylcobinamide kinase/adenosylcobinamide-phosphate guanylyltransferase [Treponema sp.]|jgi:adenosyl cobinamide kinase/adenosyl cobinamide phosphate guanylyltransferase|nr:bifunctional adenosylcobinamide kinase/adenosylcobinamide-phosphate guanylyltransferase [Treponema sp.]